MLNSLPHNPQPGSAALESAGPLTATTDAWHYRPQPPRSLAMRRLLNVGARTTRRNNIPHSSPAIRGFAQSGFNEVAPAHAHHLVRDLTEASRFPGLHMIIESGQL